MILDLSMLFRSMKGTKDLLRVLIFILIVPSSSALQKMEPLRFGTVKKEDYNILFNHTPIQQNSVVKEITLSQEVRTK